MYTVYRVPARRVFKCSRHHKLSSSPLVVNDWRLHTRGWGTTCRLAAFPPTLLFFFSEYFLPSYHQFIYSQQTNMGVIIAQLLSLLLSWTDLIHISYDDHHWIGNRWPDSDVVNLPPYTEFRPFIVLTVPYVRYEDGQAAHSISSHRSHRESWWWCCCGSWSAFFRIRFGLLPEQLSGFRFIDRCSHCTSCKWCGSVKEVIRVMIRCRFGVKGGQDECRTTSAHINLSPSVYTVFLWFSLHDLRLHGLLSGVINSLHCNWMVIVIDLWWMELLLSETVLSGGEVYRVFGVLQSN